MPCLKAGKGAPVCLNSGCLRDAQKNSPRGNGLSSSTKRHKSQIRRLGLAVVSRRAGTFFSGCEVLVSLLSSTLGLGGWVGDRANGAPACLFDCDWGARKLKTRPRRLPIGNPPLLNAIEDTGCGRLKRKREEKGVRKGIPADKCRQGEGCGTNPGVEKESEMLV